MFEPGAKMSTQGPTFEKPERASVMVDEATVVAVNSPAGDLVHASAVVRNTYVVHRTARHGARTEVRFRGKAYAL